jgi:hypothetical protein
MVSKGDNVSIILCMRQTNSYLVLVGAEAEVLDRLTGVLGSSEEEGVASSGSTESQLIQSQDLSSSSQNARTSGGSESKSGNADLGDGQEAVIIGDGANNHNSALVILAILVRNDSRDRDGGSVDARHKESAEDDLVEGRLGSACEEEIRIDDAIGCM